MDENMSPIEETPTMIPLSLSGVAHGSINFKESHVDALKQVLSHTLISCVNYARITLPPYEWSFQDVVTSKSAWVPVQAESPPTDLPPALQNDTSLRVSYTRTAFLYIRSALPTETSPDEHLRNDDNWKTQPGVLGKIVLRYAAKDFIEADEFDPQLKTQEGDSQLPDEANLQQRQKQMNASSSAVLYQATVEYRSKPATGNKAAVQAEELSMLGLGGNMDDNVKYGALAAIYDPTAKYVMEIFSVRGKKYKFDLMDATLANGSLPQLPSTLKNDAFVKFLGVAVSDHSLDTSVNSIHNNGYTENFAVTRIHLTIDGQPRWAKLPPLYEACHVIQKSFFRLNPKPPRLATAYPCGHSLILDSDYAGRIYINGMYVTTWGQDIRIGNNGIALFGMDLQGIACWHGRIVDFDAVRQACAALWQDILVDARLMDLQIGRRLLYRLLQGYEWDDAPQENDTSADCLETQVLVTTKYDRVGIAAKALSTRFRQEFGTDAFPCLEHEEKWVKSSLPTRKPIVVPARLLSILRRGGYFDVQRTVDDLWFAQARVPRNAQQQGIITQAVLYVQAAGGMDVALTNIVVCSVDVVGDVVGSKAVVRYNSDLKQYCVNEFFFDTPFGGSNGALQAASYLLGLYLAEAHPNGGILAAYLLRARSS